MSEIHPLAAVVFALALACFASSVWSIFKFFKNTEKLQPEMVVLKYLGGATMVSSLVMMSKHANEVADRSSTQTIVSSAFYIAALILFWSAYRANSQRPLRVAYTAGAPPHFVNWGPYSRIRHPFYTSYIIAWTAGPLATDQWWLVIPGMIMTFLYYRAARLEERQFADSAFAAEYAELRRRTGMFWPGMG